MLHGGKVTSSCNCIIFPASASCTHCAYPSVARSPVYSRPSFSRLVSGGAGVQPWTMRTMQVRLQQATGWNWTTQSTALRRPPSHPPLQPRLRAKVDAQPKTSRFPPKKSLRLARSPTARPGFWLIPIGRRTATLVSWASLRWKCPGLRRALPKLW